MIWRVCGASGSPVVARFAVVCLLVAALLASPAAVGVAAAGTRVMPLGDSITDGYNVPGGYRINLEDLLVAGGYSFDFVGSRVNGPSSLADRNHEGRSGFRIDEIAAVANVSLATHQPEVVLLLIGTNDMIQNYSVDSAPQRLSALIDQITRELPSSTVIVSSLPPLAHPTREQRVLAYNAAIPDIVSDKLLHGKKVHFVDMHAALTTSELADGVHPNAAGYNRMAGAWYESFHGVLPRTQDRTEAQKPNTADPAAPPDVPAVAPESLATPPEPAATPELPATPPGPALAPLVDQAPMPAPARAKTNLRIRKTTLGRKAVTVTGTRTRAATGRVTIVYKSRASGRRLKAIRSVRVRGGRFTASLKLPVRTPSARQGVVTVRYAGDARHLPRTVTRSVRRR